MIGKIKFYRQSESKATELVTGLRIGVALAIGALVNCRVAKTLCCAAPGASIGRLSVVVGGVAIGLAGLVPG